MAVTESIFYWVGFILYILAWIMSLSALIFKKKLLEKVAIIVGLVAFVGQTTAIIIRWAMIGHPPLFGSFENSLAASWTIIIFSFFVMWKYRGLKNIGVVSYVVALLLLLWGQIPVFNKHQIPLTISERSLWLDIHVLFAWFAFGSLLTAWALAGLWMTKARKLKKTGQQDTDTIDYLSEVIFKFLVFGFITYTAMIALGSFYEFILFGKWWQWDIVESLSLVTWLFYGTIIHLHLFYSWRGKGLMIMVLLAPLGIFSSYFVIALLFGKTFHTFDLSF